MRTVCLSNYTFGYMPSRNEYMCYHKDLFNSFQSTLLAIVQLFTNSKMERL